MSAPYTPSEIGHLWFDKIWNERDASMAYELMAPDAVGYLEGDQKIIGPEPFLEFQQQFLETIPDLHIVVTDSVADDDAVCVQWLAKGTHTGGGMGFAPSGQPVSFRGVTWFKVRDGKVTDGRDFWNMSGLMQTLAAGPPAAAH